MRQARRKELIDCHQKGRQKFTIKERMPVVKQTLGSSNSCRMRRRGARCASCGRVRNGCERTTAIPTSTYVWNHRRDTLTLSISSLVNGHFVNDKNLYTMNMTNKTFELCKKPFSKQVNAGNAQGILPPRKLKCAAGEAPFTAVNVCHRFYCPYFWAPPCVEFPSWQQHNLPTSEKHTHLASSLTQ